MKAVIVILLLLLIGLQYRLWFGEGSWMEVKLLKDKINEQQAINERLKEKNRILTAKVEKLKNGTQALEEKARSDLGMIKEGETFYLFVDKDEQKK